MSGRAPPCPPGRGDHRGIAPTRHHHPAVLLVRRQPVQRAGGVGRRGQHLHEERADLLHQGQIGLTVRGDDGSERRHRIAVERQAIGLHQARRGCQPAGIGVLDDRHGRLGELLRHRPRSFQIDQVVVAQTPCPGAARTRARRRPNGRAPPVGAGSRRSAAVARARPPTRSSQVGAGLAPARRGGCKTRPSVDAAVTTSRSPHRTRPCAGTPSAPAGGSG